MRSAIGFAVSCAAVMLAACAGSSPAPVQPYSSEAPQPVASSSAEAPSPAASSAPAAPAVDDGRADECDKLAKTINANGDSFKEGLAKAADPKAPKGAWSDLATAVDEAGGKVKELGLKDKKLKSWAQQYVGLMTELAALLRQTDTDFKKKDKAALKKDIGEIGNVDSKEAELTGKINGYCNP
jgi:hypothetical protein